MALSSASRMRSGRRDTRDRTAAGSGSDGARRRRMRLGRAREQRAEMKRAAASHDAVDPDAALHQLHQLGRDRQAQAGAAVLPGRRAIGLHERAEDLATACPTGTPMPVSRTAKCSCTVVGGRRPSRRPSTTTSPVSVNFTALPTRFSSTCRSRPGSPISVAGHASGRSCEPSVSALLARPRRHQPQRVGHRVAQAERDGLELEPARFDLREVEDVVDERQQRLGGLARRADQLSLLRGQRRS